MYAVETSEHFSLKEVENIIKIIECIYDTELSLSQFTNEFMTRLKRIVYFDKSDFMFFTYNPTTEKYEMQSFHPINWTDDEINNYIETYMHIDDVLPILTQPGYVSFRNDNMFSLEKRRKTRYFKEFATDASLELSIDANIPLPDEYNIIAILGLFRNIEKVEFSARDLEIIKLLQPHLVNRMITHFDRTSGKSISSPDLMLDNIETLGICTYSAEGELLNNNLPYRNFALHSGKTIETSLFSTKIKKLINILVADNSTDRLGPAPIEVNGNTFMVQMAFNDMERSKLTVAVYYVTEIYTKRFIDLKDEYDLSNREFEIIFLSMKEGLSNSEIAEKLFISEATVKRHIYTCYQKIGINNHKQLLKKLQIL